MEVVRPSEKTFPDPPLGDRDPVLLTALVCPRPTEVLRRLKASNAEIGRAAALEKGPGEPRALDQLSVRRWLADVGPAAADLSALWALRHGGHPPWSAAMAEIHRRGDALTRADLAIGGADLQPLGIQGPGIGEMLATLLDRVLDDPTLNTRESLLAIARESR
jgi:tRNA nucleotidyltransferase (CCA-adding enzyme)